MKELQAQIAKLQQEKQEALGHAESLQSAVTLLKQEKCALESEKQGFIAQLASVASTSTQVKAETDNATNQMQERIKNLEGELAQLKSAAEVSSVADGRNQSLEQNLAAAKSRVSSMEQQVTSAHLEANQLRIEVAGLKVAKERADKLEAEVSELKCSNSIMEAEVGNLKAALKVAKNRAVQWNAEQAPEVTVTPVSSNPPCPAAYTSEDIKKPAVTPSGSEFSKRPVSSEPLVPVAYNSQHTEAPPTQTEMPSNYVSAPLLIPDEYSASSQPPITSDTNQSSPLSMSSTWSRPSSSSAWC